MQILLDRIKIQLRISHSKLDDVIKADIDASLLELKRVGIETFCLNENGEQTFDENGVPILKDDLVRKASELFVKGQEDFMSKGEQYTKAFDKMRDALSLSGDYKNEK